MAELVITDSDELQMRDHPAHGAYLVKVGPMFRVRCEVHRRTPRSGDRSYWFMPQAIAVMQKHNLEMH